MRPCRPSLEKSWHWKQEKTAIEAEIASLAAPITVVALHPAAIAHYLKIVDDLAAAISARDGAAANGIRYPRTDR